jgi:hypothetical protein
MLDPACGSMHFGLYAFDLFEVIYEEFWDLTTENTEHFSNSSPSSVSSVHSVVNHPTMPAITPELIAKPNKQQLRQLREWLDQEQAS